MSEEYQNTDAESTSIGIMPEDERATRISKSETIGRRSLAVRLITVVTQVQL